MLLIDAILGGARPEKPKGAAGLGFTEDLWITLELCWLEDRSARPSVEDILPYLNDARLRWSIRTAVYGNGGQDSNDPDHFPSQQPAPSSSDPPSTCRLDGCNRPVFVDKVAKNISEYCSQGHRE